MSAARPFGFQAKVLISVISIMVLLQVVTIGLVNRRLSYQFEMEAARDVVFADAVFNNSKQIRTKNLLLRYRNLPNEPRLKAVFQLADPKTLSFLLEELLAELKGTLIVFTTEDGQRGAVASRDAHLKETQEFEIRGAAAIQRALAGEPSVDTIGVASRLFDVVSVPVRVGDRLVGALTFGLELDESVAKEFKQLTDCEIILFSRDRVAASTLSQTTLFEQGAAALGQGPDTGASQVRFGQNPVRQITLHGEHFIHSIGQLPSLSGDPDLRYVLLASYEKPLRVLKSTQHVLLMVLFLGLLFGSFIVLVLIRRLTQPLRQLRRNVVAVGHGDFSQRVPVTTRDEIGGLAEAFNQMTGNLLSSRQQLEQTVDALRTSENFLHSLVENLPQCIYHTEEAGRFTFANERFCRMMGRTLNQIVGKTFAELLPAELAAKFQEEDEPILRDRKQLDTEVQHAMPDQGKMFWHLIKTPLYDKFNQPIGIQGIFWDVTERKRAEAEKASHAARLETSRLSGMAEIATNVLHNVGNVLNSVNISAGLIVESVKKSRASSLTRVVVLLREHEHDLGDFITHDSKGKQLPTYLAQLSEHLVADQAAIVSELDSLRRNVEHIKEIVAMQQKYAMVGGVKEVINVVNLVEDSLRINEGALSRHGVEVIREFENVPPLNVEKHKILQILVNLVRNAKHACQDAERPDKRLTVRVTDGDGRVKISVIDNGIGIPPENLTRIFNHGFTTRKDGHGFGLHSGALAAREMGGSLTVHSDGPGQGAVFTLELPCLVRENAHE